VYGASLLLIAGMTPVEAMGWEFVSLRRHTNGDNMRDGETATDGWQMQRDEDGQICEGIHVRFRQRLLSDGLISHDYASTHGQTDLTPSAEGCDATLERLSRWNGWNSGIRAIMCRSIDAIGCKDKSNRGRIAGSCESLGRCVTVGFHGMKWLRRCRRGSRGRTQRNGAIHQHSWYEIQEYSSLSQ